MALTYADLVTQAGTNPYAPLTYGTQNQRVTTTAKPKTVIPTTNAYTTPEDYTPSINYTLPFNLTPQPTTGQGAYGAVPGPVGVPPNLWEQIGGVYPAADQLGQASDVIGNQLAGQLSPEEIAAYQTYGAQFGVGKGTPLSTFAGQAGLLNVGRGVAATQQAGLSNYERMLGSLSGLMTPQNLATDIAERNALMAAAPDPQAAAEQQMQDFMDKWKLAQQASEAGPQQGTMSRGPTSITPPPATMPTFQTGGGGAVAPGYSDQRGTVIGGQVYTDAQLKNLAASGGGLKALQYGQGPMGAGTYSNAPFNYDPFAESGFGFQQVPSGSMYLGPNYQYTEPTPPGAYPESDIYGNVSYNQPEDWWLQGYGSPEEYAADQDQGYYDYLAEYGFYPEGDYAGAYDYYDPYA